jgi:signal transduction histidine kinase
VPVAELLGRAPRRPRGKVSWRALVQWRDWSLPVKLSAVTVVPLVLALVLGVTTIAGQVGRSDEYQRLDRLVSLGGQVRALTGALQQERTVTAAMLTDGTVGGTPELTAARTATDAAAGPFTAAQARAGAAEPGVAGAAGAATAQVGNLGFLRRQVDGGQLDPAQAVTAYSGITGSLIGLDTAATAGAGDGTLGGTPAGLHELLVAGEQVSLSQAVVSYGIARTALSPSELTTLRGAELRLADRLVDFRSAAGDTLQRDFAAIAEGTQAQSRARMVESVLAAQPDSVRAAFRALSAADWNAASAAMRTQIAEVAGRLGTSASDTSARLVEESGSDAGLLAVLLFAAVVLAVAVVFLITRQLLRSLQVLRRSALDVAETALPEAVRNIQEGRAQGTDVTPVPVRTDDEIGEVARAFDKVHHQALRLATEQAAMRTGYGSVFVNLSRRSQSLVQRQLQLIEQLERDEEDADQLATLFQLDHLATRMRRNNENLMVLSGAEPGRRSGKPVGTTDMLRAAVSEIEQYQRVQVQPPPPARVVGYAASDLMRLVAELLDNATAFSAPETSVTVASRLGEDGSLEIDILDKGIGMNEAEVAEANTRLTEAGSVDLVTSRRMGLFVVGRLASRHRIGVSLHGGKGIVGVRATVVVPAELVMPATDGPATGPVGTVQQSPLSRATGTQLPRRVNGHARPRPVVPPQPVAGEERWPSASDLAGLANGHERPPTDLEISGTDLFAPIPRDDDAPPQRPAVPPVPVVLPVPKPPRHDDLPAGRDLFSANETTLSDWWRQATGKLPQAPVPAPAPVPSLDPSETTPIFDEMLSAWFREDKPPGKPAADKPAAARPVTEEEPAEGAAEEGAAEPPERRSWDFASDEDWRTVQAVTQAEPTAFTEAGLPRRRRGEQLMPGSAASGPPALARPAPPHPDLPVRDPADIRGRLSSFQQGVTRGREEARQAAANAQGAAASGGAAASQTPVTQPNGSQQRGSAPRQPNGTQPGGVLPEPGQLPAARRPGRELPPALRRPGQDQPPSAAAPGREHQQGLQRPSMFGVPGQDQPPAAATPPGREQAARPLASRQPGQELPSALRQPGQQRPGGQQQSGEPQWPGGQHPEDPDPARFPSGQLSAFMDPGRPPSPGPAASPPVLPHGRREPAPAADPPALRQDEPSQEVTAEWNFGPDAGWRTVQAVSQSTPATFTSAGLPRRRRGEQLLPGSAAPPTGAPAPRPQRDAHDVRGRLRSFQQGIERGRHRTARAAETNHETLEGE